LTSRASLYCGVYQIPPRLPRIPRTLHGCAGSA